MLTYTAKVLEKIDNPPNQGRPTWNSIRVGVFRVEEDREEQIGEYVRIYPAFFNTFCYFRRGDKEYALYSPNYTATRVMELPSCRDLGGEEPHTHGFCPTDFYVPSYIDREVIRWNGSITRHRCNQPRPEDLVPRTDKYHVPSNKLHEMIEAEDRSYPVSSHLYYSFGFVAGCIWGDDSTYKIQYLDLSQADQGIIKRDERFGYIKLPEKVALKDAIDMQDYHYFLDDNDPDYSINMTIQVRYDLSTGKMLNY